MKTKKPLIEKIKEKHTFGCNHNCVEDVIKDVAEAVEELKKAIDVNQVYTGLHFVYLIDKIFGSFTKERDTGVNGSTSVLQTEGSGSIPECIHSDTQSPALEQFATPKTVKIGLKERSGE